MSRIVARTVGRKGTCDVVLRDGSVSRCHAEVVCLPDGRIHVADRPTANGTFVRRGSDWLPIHQALLDPTDVLRFGECTITAGELGALCDRAGASSAEQAAPGQPRSRLSDAPGLDKNRE